MSLAPRVVMVQRKTEYTELVERHGTAGQAAFFLGSRGVDLAEIRRRHEQLTQVTARVAADIPVIWRRGSVERADLARFPFAPEDIVVVIGADGLVPNLARYLNGQIVIGINPDASSAVLVRHRASDAAELMRAAAAGRIGIESRTMVRAAADDGQELIALNEIYLGHASHQTARYELAAPDGTERQASSGVLVATGTGSTGWARSIARERHHERPLPGPADRRLQWFVREAWPSPTTGADRTDGTITDEPLRLRIESDALVAFGDGMEADAITVSRGQQVTFGPADRTLNLAV